MKKNSIIIVICIVLVLGIQTSFIANLQKGSNINSIGNDFTSNPKSSTIIYEDSDEFLEGTMENVTISNNGYLMLESDFPYQPFWTNMAPSTNPGKISEHSMVYDSKHDKIIFFGGWNSSGYNAETWVYDLGTNIWTNMTPSTHPSARSWHSMVYDSKHDKVILFGGYALSNDNDETWVYDLATNTWTNMTPSTHPSARYIFSMVYDSKHDKVILFGGYALSNDNDETWVYDLATNTWINMTPSTHPSARSWHSMVYDSKHDKVILFGGVDEIVGLYGDTWTYDLDTNMWINMTPSTHPSARCEQTMIYDSINDKVVLFGGYSSGLNDETWTYDLNTNNWTMMAPISKPSARVDHSMVYDSTNGKIVLFGGEVGAAEFDDHTWTFGLKYHHIGTYESKIRSLDYFKCSGEILWSPENQPVGTNLTVQIGFSNSLNDDSFIYTSPKNSSFTFEAEAHYFRYRIILEATENLAISPMLEQIIIGYFPKIESLPIIIEDSDEFLEGTLDNVTISNNGYLMLESQFPYQPFWTNMAPSTHPSERYIHSMVYNSKHDKVILFGGETSSERSDETWSYDLSTNSWTNMTMSIYPDGRSDHSMVYNSNHDKVILFGGYTDEGLNDETWSYSLDTNNWTMMAPITKPTARIDHSMVYDSINGKLILFGGVEGPSDLDDQTWTYGLEYQQTGTYNSKIRSLNYYKCSGEISWTPENQPVGTNLTVQIGFSNHTNDDSFMYTSPQNSSFTFEGEALYFRYRINFKATDNLAISPTIENVRIVIESSMPPGNASTQPPLFIYGAGENSISSEDYVLETILISSLIGVGSIGVVSAVAVNTILKKRR